MGISLHDFFASLWTFGKPVAAVPSFLEPGSLLSGAYKQGHSWPLASGDALVEGDSCFGVNPALLTRQCTFGRLLSAVTQAGGWQRRCLLCWQMLGRVTSLMPSEPARASEVHSVPVAWGREPVGSLCITNDAQAPTRSPESCGLVIRSARLLQPHHAARAKSERCQKNEASGQVQPFVKRK